LVDLINGFSISSQTTNSHRCNGDWNVPGLDMIEIRLTIPQSQLWHVRFDNN
jgi:hypothetical protein